jgi:hypothetical protein
MKAAEQSSKSVMLVDLRESAKIRGAKKVVQKQMRPGPATRAASFVDLLSCLPAARSRGPTVLVRQRPRGVPLLPVLAAGWRFGESPRRNPCGGQRPRPLRRADRRGGRNARATGMRSRAFPISPGNSPSRIASCHRRHRKHRPASLENCHVFAEPTLRQNVARRNRKTFGACAEAVEDESCLWKAEEKPAPIAARKMRAPTFQ